MLGSVEILLTVYTPSLQTFSGKTGRQRASSAQLVPAEMKMESPRLYEGGGLCRDHLLEVVVDVGAVIVVESGGDGLDAAVGAYGLPGVVKKLKVLSQRDVRHAGEPLAELREVERTVMVHKVKYLLPAVSNAFSHYISAFVKQIFGQIDAVHYNVSLRNCQLAKKPRRTLKHPQKLCVTFTKTLQFFHQIGHFTKRTAKYIIYTYFLKRNNQLSF